MRVTSKGQVTIPVEIRRKAGLLPDTEVEFGFNGEVATLRPSRNPKRKTRGDRLVEHLQRFKGDIEMTADEIMALTRGE